MIDDVGVLYVRSPGGHVREIVDALAATSLPALEAGKGLVEISHDTLGVAHSGQWVVVAAPASTFLDARERGLLSFLEGKEAILWFTQSTVGGYVFESFSGGNVAFRWVLVQGEIAERAGLFPVEAAAAFDAIASGEGSFWDLGALAQLLTGVEWTELKATGEH